MPAAEISGNMWDFVHMKDAFEDSIFMFSEQVKSAKYNSNYPKALTILNVKTPAYF